jgi:hypothetical protein
MLERVKLLEQIEENVPRLEQELRELVVLLGQVLEGIEDQAALEDVAHTKHRDAALVRRRLGGRAVLNEV